LKAVFLKTLPIILIIIAIWIPRGLALDQFVTVDEQKWLTRSANYYQALVLTNFENTYQRDHPGVTTMWAGTLGFLWQFPDYIRETPGQHKQHLTKDFKSYLEHRGYDPLQLLEAGRFFLLIGILIVLVLSFISAIRLIGLIPAVVGFLLIAFDPFSIGISRLLRPDAILSPLMLLSLIAFMNYLYRGRHLYDLMLAALAAGLAWLTKSPALFLIPFFSLLSIIEFARLWWKERRFSFQDVWNVAWPFMVWVGIAALVFVLLWPAMWVNPIGTIQMIFTEASDYAEEGHHSATFFNGQIYPAGTSDWLFYPINYLWRTTPTILVGLLLASIAIIFRRNFSTSKQHQQAILAISLFAVLFTVLMTFGSKKFDRYLLPVVAPLALVAAMGWFIIVNRALKFFASFWVSGSKADKVIRIGGAFLLILILLTQMIGPLQTFPYYFSYYNPIMGGSR
jgi:4-amino-4-deoxy-L-arabinose transferase-like glycosyltransferase